MDKVKLIKDKIHGNIEFNHLEGDIFATALYNRLHFILQNSMAFSVYPSNKTSRFEHSLGVMQIATDIYKHGISNASIDTAIHYLKDKQKPITQIKEKVKNDLSKDCDVFDYEKHKNIDIDIPLLQNIFGRPFINNNFLPFTIYKDNQNLITSYYLLLEIVRLGALFHDVGHLPFSHLTEFAIDAFYNFIEKEKIDNTKLRENLKQIKTPKHTTKQQLHEQLGIKLSSAIFDYLIQYKYQKDCKKIFVLRIIQKLLEEFFKGKHGNLYSLYLIISSDLDADRLDYVIRDMDACGFKHSVDIDRITKLYILEKNKDNNYSDNFKFFPALQSISDINSFFLLREKLYKVVINHHKVKRNDYILQKIIEEILKIEVKNSKEIDDNLIITYVIAMIKIIANCLNSEIHKRDIYQVSQLTDFWLLALLRNKMYKYLLNDGESLAVTNLLKEIFLDAKAYRSLFNRDFDLNFFIKELAKIAKEIDDLTKLENVRNVRKEVKLKLKNIKNLTYETKNYLKIGNLLLDIIEYDDPDWNLEIEKMYTDNTLLVAKSKLLKAPNKLYLIDLQYPSVEQSINYADTFGVKDKYLMRFFVFYKNKTSYEIKNILFNYFKNKLLKIVDKEVESV